ncbi:MAG: hypothetical protein QXU98_13835 [Candidatus Parvarchaeota archaeon]
MNEKRDHFIGLHLNYKEFRMLRRYAERVHLKQSTALKQVFLQFLDEHDAFKDILEEEKLRA